VWSTRTGQGQQVRSGPTHASRLVNRHRNDLLEAAIYDSDWFHWGTPAWNHCRAIRRCRAAPLGTVVAPNGIAIRCTAAEARSSSNPRSGDGLDHAVRAHADGEWWKGMLAIFPCALNLVDGSCAATCPSHRRRFMGKLRAPGTSAARAYPVPRSVVYVYLCTDGIRLQARLRTWPSLNSRSAPGFIANSPSTDPARDNKSLSA